MNFPKKKLSHQLITMFQHIMLIDAYHLDRAAKDWKLQHGLQSDFGPKGFLLLFGNICLNCLIKYSWNATANVKS